MKRLAWLGLLLVIGASMARAQTDSTSTNPVRRASWLSDRVGLKVGDIVTVIIDEQTTARERVTRSALEQRGLGGEIGLDGESQIALTNKFGSDSRDTGEANRTGDLYGMVAARVTAVDASGLATLQGSKTVTIDGRDQVIEVSGLVRPSDLSANNVVPSSRLAEGKVRYEGKNIKPKKGILGSILSLLWPL